SVLCHLVKIYCDVACAEYIKCCCRKHRLDKDVESAAADQARVVFEILIQVENENTELLRFHDFARRLPDVGFHTSPADSAHDRTVVTHQHLGSLKRGN